MQLDSLPDVALLRIFDCLSFTDRIRIGRVSCSFRRISQIVCARIKSLDLQESMFAKLNADQFEIILRLCQQHLREMTFRFEDMRGWASKFAQFTCPSLVNLDFSGISMTQYELDDILTNHPNLKRLKWCSMDNDMEFPPETFSHLETLLLRDLSDFSLESLIDRCPNLKSLDIELFEASSDVVWDRFFRSVPRVESLNLFLTDCCIRMKDSEWFWRLPLTSLSIKYEFDSSDEYVVDDDFIHKLVEHFVDIEQLDLCLSRTSEDGLIALSRLEKLRSASLRGIDTITDTYDIIHTLSACRRLEELNVHLASITAQTFVDLFQNCPQLRNLTVFSVSDENGLIDAQTIGMMLRELINCPRRQSISIAILCGSYEFTTDLRPTWKSTHVHNVVEDLKQTHGIDVVLCFPHPNAQLEGNVEEEMETEDDRSMLVEDEYQPTDDA